MTLEEIRELIHLVTETGVAELEVQRGDNRVRIRSGSGAASHEGTAPPPVSAKPAPVAAQPAQTAASAAGAASVAQTTADPSLVLVKSPIVGTFYESSAPGAPTFVKVGDTVQPGKVLCIIESMKLMNEIEAEISGVVESKLVLNGQPVEYGEALFAIRPI